MKKLDSFTRAKMMFNKKKDIIKEVNKKYFYNKNTGAITCKVSVCYQDDFLASIAPPYNTRIGMGSGIAMIPAIKPGEHWDDYLITATATATPAEGDVYNKATGEKIAYAKAMRKIYKIMVRLFRKAYDLLEKKETEIAVKETLMEKYWKREDNFVHSLL